VKRCGPGYDEDMRQLALDILGLAVLAVIASSCSDAGEQPKPVLDRSARERIVAAANQAVHRAMTAPEDARKGNEIARKSWGEAIERLHPLRVLNDRVNVFIVLNEDATTASGLYVSIPISSYAPGSDKRFLRFEDLSKPGDKAFGRLYRCKLRKAEPAAAPNGGSAKLAEDPGIAASQVTGRWQRRAQPERIV
jgi:hypothetical protein